MTAEEAKELGYEVRAASAIEVGLVKNGMGICTWWASHWNGKLPTLDDEEIQVAIIRQEANEAGI